MRRLFWRAKRRPAGAGKNLRCRLQFESLERRQLLASMPLITELMAQNDGTLTDEDGQSSDWIEIYNPATTPVDLFGWHLTDDPLDLDKWEFPDVTLGAAEYLVVFASAKDRVETGAELHTNFQLDADGEYLALVKPDDSTIVSQFTPRFPEQKTNASFGLAQSVSSSVLVAEGAAAKVLVPTQAGQLAADWADVNAIDASWTSGPTGIGFDTGDSGLEEAPLLAYWPLSDGLGTVALDFAADDAIGNNEGMLLSFDAASGWTTDTPPVLDVPYALEFDGANDYIQTPFVGVGGGDPRTVAFWIKTTDTSTHGIVAWGDSGTNGAKWHIRLNSSAGNGTVGAVRTEVQGGYIIGSTNIADGQWHHVASVFPDDGSPNIDDVLIYVDGQRDTISGGASEPVDTDTGPAAPDVTIGRRTQGSGYNYVDATLADVAIFGGVLPAQQVAALAAGVARPFDLNSYGDQIATDLRDEMSGLNGSAFLRVPFTVAAGAPFDQLELRMKYDDGFVAYLNGVEIARRNAPAVPAWSSTARAERADLDAVRFETINVTEYAGLLQTDNVLAIQGLNLDAADDDFLIVPELSATVITETPDRFFPEPTPGELNGPGVSGFVADTKFSVDRGFFEAPFTVEIATDTPGTRIRYTTDGSWPTATRGLLYTGPIEVTTTMTLRAIAARTDFEPTDVDTQTYIFLDDVIRQPANPPGFPSVWGSRAADYEMDQSIVNDPRYSATMKDALRTHPTISLVADLDDLFDSATGLYANPKAQGRDWERPVSVELFDFPHGEALSPRTGQVNAGLRITGKASRNPDRGKHNLRLVFRDEYGPKRLNFPLFDDTDVEQFNSILLRGGNGDSWINPGVYNRAQYIRDQWHRDLQVAMGQPTSAQGYVHLYINGLYWGLYHTIERVEDDLFAEHFGGEEEDWDVIKDLNGTTANEIVDGSMQAWNEMIDLATAGLSGAAAYAAIGQYLDVGNLIDYMLVNFYSGNNDWDHNNWRAARRREPGEGFVFFCWDSERTDLNRLGLSAGQVGAPDTNITAVDKVNQPSSVHQDLTANAEYRLLFADHVHRNFFNGGPMTPEGAAGLWNARADEIRLALSAESARFGDRHTSPAKTPADWQNHLDLMNNTFFPVRTRIVLNQLESRGLYPNVVAPSFNQHGGEVDSGFTLTMSNPSGSIYYTLDGSDPRLPGGELSATAVRYAGPVTIDRSAVVKSRTLSGSTWSALNEAGFYVNILPELTVTELNYNPYQPATGAANNDDFEFVELTNTGDIPIDLDGMAFVEGIQYELTATNTTPSLRITEFSNENPDWFEIQNLASHSVDVSGWVVAVNDAAGGIEGVHETLWELSGSMPGGQTLYQTDNDQDPFFFGENIYWANTGNGWIMILDEAGEVVDFVAWGYGQQEIASANLVVPIPTGGDGQTITVGDAWSGDGIALKAGDLTSLQRVGDADSDTAADWQLAEPQSPGMTNTGLTWPFFNSGIELAPGESLVLAKDPAAFETRYDTSAVVLGPYDGRLANSGERLTLIDRSGQPIVNFRYDDSGAWPEWADGAGASLELIDPAAVPQTDPQRTLYLEDPAHWQAGSRYGGSPGFADPPVPSDIVINEIVSQSIWPAVDWIELHNRSDVEVSLGGWYLSDSSDQLKKYRIPNGVTIPAGGYVVFDEHDFNPDPANSGPDDFALSATNGDDVWLMEAELGGRLTRFVDHVEFGASAPGESFGRWPNAEGEPYPSAVPSPLEPNNRPRVGPVVISEVMYNPTGLAGADDLEFVEIYNASTSLVSLTDWRIRKGIDFAFPVAAALAAGATLVVVPFDPTETDKLTAFRQHYGIGASVAIVGGYSGVLDNGGERVQLQRSGAIVAPDIVPHLLEDELRYDSIAPWPGDPDGNGESLTRRAAQLWGHDSNSWIAAPPSPGMVDFSAADDAYEPNDTRAEAHNLGGYPGTWLSAIDGLAVQADDDWYMTNVEANARRLTAEVTFSHAEGNIDLSLVDSSGNIYASATSGNDGEQIDVVLPWPGTWYVHVAGDGTSNAYDLRLAARYAHPGDANLDGGTDLSDFNIWNANKFRLGTDWQSADFNGDGRTDLSDFNIWNAYKFTSTPSPPPLPPPAAHDAVLERAVVPISQSARPETTLLDKAVWLREFEQMASSRREDSDGNRHEDAVDKLLATYWP